MWLRLAGSAALALVLLFGAITLGMRTVYLVNAWREPERPDEVPLHLADVEELEARRRADLEALREFVGVGLSERLRGAVAASDLRYLGLGGVPPRVPGVASARHGFAPARIHAIPGTAEAPWSDEHAALVERASRYASAYNALLLRHFAEVAAPPR